MILLCDFQRSGLAGIGGASENPQNIQDALRPAACCRTKVSYERETRCSLRTHAREWIRGNMIRKNKFILLNTFTTHSQHIHNTLAHRSHTFTLDETHSGDTLDMPDTAEFTAAVLRENAAAERRYLESCSELSSAISTLESAVTAFVGKDRGDIKVRTGRWPANPDADRPLSVISVILVASRCSLKPARGSSRSSRELSSQVRHHQEANSLCGPTQTV